MELSELFLHQKGKHDNKISIARGLNFANNELIKRLKGYEDCKEVDYFFNESKEPNRNFHELMKLWEVCKGKLELLNHNEKMRFWVLDIIYEMDGHYYTLAYEGLIAEMGEVFAAKVDKLADKIESIRNSKIIKLLDSNMEEVYEISLNRFSKYIFGFENEMVKYRLAQFMISGGVAVVIAGSDGLTPKRLHGFKLDYNTWEEYPSEKLEPHREELLKSNIKAKERGKIRGYS